MRRWNDDPFTKKAKKENYQARSVYKLEEIDRRDKILGQAKKILDLGASPGSWTQYCLEKAPLATVFAIDIAPIKVEHPRLKFLQVSIDGPELAELIGQEKMDLVLSDMAPKTSGIHDRDVALSLELCDLALRSCGNYLRDGGNFVVKVFMGDDFEDYHERVKKVFREVRLLRPETTRKHSREIYLIGKGFRGRLS